MKIYKTIDGRCNVAGIKIRQLRELAGISQEVLAAKFQMQGINVTQKTISRIETGERLVADYELIEFSKALNVSVQELTEIDK